MGTLYVIGTPIGNLEDLTLRASRILSSVPLVAAEDTRVTRRLLAHLDAHPRLFSCHEHNWRRQLPRLLDALAEGERCPHHRRRLPRHQRPGRRPGRCGSRGRA